MEKYFLDDKFVELCEAIWSDYSCPVAQTLIRIHEDSSLGEMFSKELGCIGLVKDKLRYLPVNRKLKLNDDLEVDFSNFQTGKIAKVLRRVFELFDRQLVVEQVKVDKDWITCDLQSGTYFHDGALYVIPEDAETREKVDIVHTFTDRDYECFVNNIKAYDIDNFIFEIVEGNDIPYWYCGDHYESFNDSFPGSLWNSCMREMPDETFDIYSCSKSVCRMLILKTQNNTLIGRALIWETNKGTFMDRIYSTSDSLIRAFVNYAVANKWMYKTQQSANTCRRITRFSEEKGEYIEVSKTITIQVAKGTWEDYPYMDTFKYYNSKTGTLSNSGSSPWDYELESTDGAYSDHREMQLCAVSGNAYAEDDMVFVDEIGDYVHLDHTIETIHNDIILLANSVDLPRIGVVHKDMVGNYIEVDGAYYEPEDVEELEDGTYKIICYA